MALSRWISKALLQFQIVSAVANRELQLRSVRGLFGVAGVFLEPLALILTFTLLRIVIRSSGGGQYMNPVLWLSLGFVPFFMFSDVAISALAGVKKGTRLYFYRRIRPLDTLMGNALLTGQIFGLLMLLFVLGVAALEWRPIVHDPGALIFLFVGMGLLGFGVGLSALVIGRRLPLVGWMIKMLLRRILLWTSCVFFSVYTFPDVFRPWILWNPVAHGVELMRSAINPAYPIPGVSAVYFWLWVLSSVGFGLFVYGNNEELLFAPEQSLVLDELGQVSSEGQS
jgi:capsular polysaccharide transport system permease protein